MNVAKVSCALAFVFVLNVMGCSQQSPPEVPPEPPQIEIIFVVNPPEIKPGECAQLIWEALDAQAMALDGVDVPLTGGTEVCPETTRTYELIVVTAEGVVSRALDVVIRQGEEPPGAEPGGEGGQPGKSAEPVEPHEMAPPGIPAYQADSWVFTGGPPGGLGYDIRMRPDNPDIMFVTDAHAGVHKSTDGGLTWFPSNTGIQAVLGNDIPIFCLTIDPHNYDVIWAGTQLTGHVYRSDNNGESWSEIDNGITEEGRSIRGITIDPNNPNVIYAAGEVETVTWATEKNLPEPHGFGGEVYKSTDGGQSWKRIWSGDNIARYVWIDPRNSNRVYVSTGIFDREAANSSPGNLGGVGILRSDDGGQSWTVLNESNGLGGLIIPSLFMHPQDPDTLIAAVSFSNAESHGVFITYNGGDTWLRAQEGPPISDAVEIATSNPDIWYSATEGVISRSDDAGKTWFTYSLSTPDRNAGMPIDLQVDPRNPSRIFDNNYGGGNFLSEDGGQTWVDASVGYSGAAMAGMLVLPGDGRSLLVGANTGGFRSADAGGTWFGTQLPAATQILLHPDGLIVSDQSGSVWHSQDDGVTWNKTKVVDMMAEVIAMRMNNDVASMRALAMSPSAPNILYAGFHDALCVSGSAVSCAAPMPNMYRSNDGGKTWQKLSGAPFDGKGILGIAVHPENSQELFAATVMGLFHSNDGGNVWSAVELFKNVVYDVVFDPSDSQVIYTAPSNGGVWRSNDGGRTWIQTSAGMDPNEPIVKVLPDPSHPNLIYAASIFFGVSVSLDGGDSWRAINTSLGPRNIFNLALSQNGSILYAGAGANGVWRLGSINQP